MGGATLAAGLAPSGASIVILERGEQLPDTPETRDARAIFQRGYFRPDRDWYDGAGQPFNPGNYYYVGGNIEVLRRGPDPLPRRGFRAIAARGGDLPGLAVRYDELEPWYSQGRELYRGARRAAATIRPSRGIPRPILRRRSPTSRPSPRSRERLRRTGLHPASLPLGVDIEPGCNARPRHGTPFPTRGPARWMPRPAALAAALAHPNVTLQTPARRSQRLIVAPDGKRIEGVECDIGGERHTLTPG